MSAAGLSREERCRKVVRILWIILILNWEVAAAKFFYGAATGSLSMGNDGIASAFDGLSNIVWPTGFAAIMAGLAGVKVEKWWKFIIPVFLGLFLTQAALMVIAVMTGFGA